MRVTSIDNNMLDTEMVLVNITEESITLQNETRLSFPLSSIDKLKVKRDKKRKTLLGALGGATFGGIVGGVVAPRDGGVFAGLDVAGYVVSGILIGTLAGTIVGALTTSDRWEKVPLDKLHLTTISNSNGAIGLGIGIAF